MNINKEQIGELELKVTVKINKDDYESKVDTVLRDYSRKANVPGFRPGKVPVGMIRKMYGKAVLVDEINKLVGESLQKYITDEQLKVLGDPMPMVSGDDLQWEIGNDFEFGFEMGLAPELDVQLSKKDHLTEYVIAVEQGTIDKDVEYYASRHGQMLENDSVVEFKEKLTGNIVQLDDSKQPLEGGFSVENSTILLALIKDKKHQEPFKDVKVGDTVEFNLSETFPNDWEIASILQTKKEDVGDISKSVFRLTINKIELYKNADVDEDLFGKIFGEDVKTKEEFENRIKKNIVDEFKEECMSKFGVDAKDYLLEKINPVLPEEFLRKWLKKVNEDKQITDEVFEREFPSFLKSMKWDLISQSIAKANDFKVEEQEIIDFAKKMTKRQFAQYGVTDFPEDALTNYAMNNLKDEHSVRQIVSQVIDQKVIDVVHDAVQVTEKEISFDDFKALVMPQEQLAGEAVSND